MEYRRISRYYPGCDGTKLAVDLYLPETAEKVPVLFNVGYEDRRRSFEGQKKALERFLEAGYAICLVEPRGHGASYGVSEGFFSRKDARDMKALIDAIAAEDWCNGRAGMFGGSNKGHIQHITLAEQPERLFAAVPGDCHVDMYYQNFPNGASALPRLPRGPGGDERMGAPVDDDPAPDFPQAAEAAKMHRFNLGFLEQHDPNMFRDTVNPKIGYAPNEDIPVWSRMDAVRYGHAEVYSSGAWFDPGCTGQILAFKSWGGRLLLGPWRHCEVYGGGSDLPNGSFDWVGEHLRFFDRVLKGLDNGSKDEPPVYYYTVGAPEGTQWRYAAEFPLDGQTQPELRFTPAGGMTEETVPEGKVEYVTREDISLFPGFGRLNRRIDGDMNENDEKCLLFDSAPLPKPIELTGVPVMEVWISSTYSDTNIIAALEEVLPDGRSRFLTEGEARASHRALGRGTVRDSLGIPYHPSRASDARDLIPGKPNLVTFNLEALSRIVGAGSRLRISLSFGGSGLTQPEGFPTEAPTVTVYTGGGAASLVRLPVVAPTVTKFVGKDRNVYAFKRAVYLEMPGRVWRKYDCRQVYPRGDEVLFVTDSFTAIRRREEDRMILTIPALRFEGVGTLPDTALLGETSPVIKKVNMGFPRRPGLAPTFRHLWVATVPVPREAPGQMNPQPVNTLDLLVNLALPDGGADRTKRWPCLVNIHGFGGSPDDWDSIDPLFLEKGVAVATVDYRLEPPSAWPASDDDAKGCLRYLKAHAEELCLDRERFAVLGGSMGGQLTAMIAACSGDPAFEGDIGGNREFDSSVKVAAAYFAPTDFFGFGEDIGKVWPSQPEKVSNGDGPYAPLASMLDYVGPGKGMGDIKAHLFDPDPKYQALIQKAKDASPVYHVTEKSAPTALVHGIFDCGIQVPMGQSLRFFEALTRKGVKSLLLCNNNGIFGEDPEVKHAVLEFICARI